MSARRGQLYGKKLKPKRIGQGLMSNKELAEAIRSGKLFEVKEVDDHVIGTVEDTNENSHK